MIRTVQVWEGERSVRIESRSVIHTIGLHHPLSRTVGVACRLVSKLTLHLIFHYSMRHESYGRRTIDIVVCERSLKLQSTVLTNHPRKPHNNTSYRTSTITCTTQPLDAITRLRTAPQLQTQSTLQFNKVQSPSNTKYKLGK
jgi:hypothetical protein